MLDKQKTIITDTDPVLAMIPIVMNHVKKLTTDDHMSRVQAVALLRDLYLKKITFDDDHNIVYLQTFQEMQVSDNEQVPIPIPQLQTPIQPQLEQKMNIMVSIPQTKVNVIEIRDQPVQTVKVCSLSVRYYPRRNFFAHLIVTIDSTNHYLVFDKICDTTLIYRPLITDNKQLVVPRSKLNISILNSVGEPIHRDETEKTYKIVHVFYKSGTHLIELELDKWFDVDEFNKGESLACSSIPGMEFVIDKVPEVNYTKWSKMLIVTVPDEYFDVQKGQWLFDASALNGASILNNSRFDSLILTVT
jgi:hypothetical protein